MQTSAFIISDGISYNFYCNLVKYDELTPLYLICALPSTENFSLNKGFNLENIHYKYNFILSDEDINNDTIHIYNIDTSFLEFIYPEILDFTSKDSLTLTMLMLKKNKDIKIRLNEDGEDLKCDYASGDL